MAREVELVHYFFRLFRITKRTLIAGFHLTFQKSFVSFANKINHKTDLKCCPQWLSHKENFLL